MSAQHQCHGKARQFLGHCDRKPTIERDGHHYCWQHDPVRLKKLADEAWAQRKREIAELEAKHDAKIHRNKLLEEAGVDKLTNEELKQIAELGGVQRLIRVTENHDTEDFRDAMEN